MNYPSGLSRRDLDHIEGRGYGGGESPAEEAERRFYEELEEQPNGALVLSNGSGEAFWYVCNLCLGDERRKVPRRYRDKAMAQQAATLHNEYAHLGQK